MFIKKVKTDLYGADVYAYIILNLHKKAKDLETLIHSKNHGKELSEKKNNINTKF